MNTDVKCSSHTRFPLTVYYIISIGVFGIFCLSYGYDLKVLEKTTWTTINTVLFFLLFLGAIITLVISSLLNSGNFIKYFFVFLVLFLLVGLLTIIYLPNNNHYSVIGNKTTYSKLVFRNPLKHSHAITINKEYGFDRLTFEVTRQDLTKYKISLIGNHKLNLENEEELLQIVRLAEAANLTPNEFINKYQTKQIVNVVKNYFLDEKSKNLQLFLQKNLDLSEWFLVHKKGSIQILELEEL
ncbi:MAG: hypothetical protein R3B60_03765 [Candidatus Paceibacterota bacterium]